MENHNKLEQDVDLVEENLRKDIEQEKRVWVLYRILY